VTLFSLSMEAVIYAILRYNAPQAVLRLRHWISDTASRIALVEKEMDENVAHDLALACRHLAQRLNEEDEGLDTSSRSRKSKEKREALLAFVSVEDQRHCSFPDLIDLLCAVYQGSPSQSQARQQVAQLLLAWAQRRDLPFGDAVEAAHTLYRISPKGSQDKQQAVQMLLTQARWPKSTMKQSIEAVTALCFASPFRSKERDQGILVLLEVAQRPDLSVEDALAFITLDSDHICTIATTSAVLTKRQVAVRQQMLEALARRADLTSEQAAQIAEAVSSFSDAQL